MDTQRNAYEKKLYAQIQEWSVDIVLLKLKADTARADQKFEYFKAIKTLEHKQDEVKMTLQEVKAARARSQVIDLKKGMEKAWPEFRAA